MKLTVTEISIHPEDQSPIYSELATKIRLEDDGAGKFVSITQDTDRGVATIRLDFEEFEWLLLAVNTLKEGINL